MNDDDDDDDDEDDDDDGNDQTLAKILKYHWSKTIIHLRF